MESLSRSPPIPQCSLDVAGCFNSTSPSANSILDSASLPASVEMQASKGSIPKKKRNAGERIQRRYVTIYKDWNAVGDPRHNAVIVTAIIGETHRKQRGDEPVNRVSMSSIDDSRGSKFCSVMP